MEAENRMPTRLSSAVFWGKASLLKLRRGVVDVAGGIRRYPSGERAGFPYVLAESRTPLWIEESLAERTLQLGKVQNLRCALRNLNGATIPAGGLFSFWKQIRRATRRRGYVAGRQLREGCLYPAIGGGLCQLSNALYDVALQAEAEIVERHAHSHIVPGSAAALGRDAAIAWNYVDLRFRPQQPLLIEAVLTHDGLIVRLRGRQPVARRQENAPTNFIPLAARTATAIDDTRPVPDAGAHSCMSCGVEACFRHQQNTPAREQAHLSGRTRTAYLMDERWPEFERYLAETHTDNDVLGIPLDGARWNQPRYAWDTTGYARVGAATWQTLARSFATRRLGKYGAARLQAQLDCANALAERLARELTPDVTRVCVAQSLLPFLWEQGHLGGRAFEVVMTRLPLETLHARLDTALRDHPERRTLGEFRAPDRLVEAEAEALAAADRIVTPHAEIAALFPDRAVRLDWHLPAAKPPALGCAVAFPGPTAARKGAYALREAARALDLEIVQLGSELEGEDFWKGVRTRRVIAGPGSHWLDGVGLVVQPALVEDRPRPLLAALAAGVQVLATSACGLGDLPGVTAVAYDDAAALQEAICTLLGAIDGRSEAPTGEHCVSIVSDHSPRNAA